MALLKLAIAGNWPELTVAPGIHPMANVMIDAPAGRAAPKMHFNTVVVGRVQVGAVASLPVNVAVVTVVKYPAAGSVNWMNEF